MIDARFVLLGAVLNIAGVFTYAVATIKGSAQPNRITWLLWAVAPMIAFAAQLSAGVGIRALMTFMVGFGPLVIFLSSLFNRKSYWKLSTFDWMCGALSVMALVAWQLSSVARVAIALSILADALAGAPTIMKSYRNPESENGIPYAGGLLSATITLLTIEDWSFEFIGFPIYLVTMSAILLILIYRPARKYQDASYLPCHKAVVDRSNPGD